MKTFKLEKCYDGDNYTLTTNAGVGIDYVLRLTRDELRLMANAIAMELYPSCQYPGVPDHYYNHRVRIDSLEHDMREVKSDMVNVKANVVEFINIVKGCVKHRG